MRLGTWYGELGGAWTTLAASVVCEIYCRGGSLNFCRGSAYIYRYNPYDLHPERLSIISAGCLGHLSMLWDILTGYVCVLQVELQGIRLGSEYPGWFMYYIMRLANYLSKYALCCTVQSFARTISSTKQNLVSTVNSSLSR